MKLTAGLHTRLLSGALAAAMFVSAGCGRKARAQEVPGTYSDPDGAFVLLLKPGGQATFTLGGQLAYCSYTVSGKNLHLICENKGKLGQASFTIQDDGTIVGPPGTVMPPLKKQ